MTKIFVIVICHKSQRIRVEYERIKRKTIVYLFVFLLLHYQTTYDTLYAVSQNRPHGRKGIET